MALEKDDVVEVTQKDETGSGWWLVKKNGVEAGHLPTISS